MSWWLLNRITVYSWKRVALAAMKLHIISYGQPYNKTIVTQLGSSNLLACDTPRHLTITTDVITLNWCNCDKILSNTMVLYTTTSLIFSNAQCHDDIIKWKHFPRYWPFVRGIHRSPVDSPHKSQWRGAFMYLICVWTNNRDAGTLGHHRAHHQGTVMITYKICT